MTHTFWRLLRLAAPFWKWMSLAAVLGFATIGSSIGLMTASAYIIAKAALQPSIADLQVAIVGVRFFGIARGVFRYLERLVSHQVNLRLLARLRVWFYASLEPLAPARLAKYRGGDILSRIVGDIETLEHFYVRVFAPPVVAALVAVVMWFFMGRYNPRLAVTTLVFLALAGIGVPTLTRVLSRGLGRRLVAVRSELNVALVDGVQGVAELLAFGADERQGARVAALSRESAALQGRMAWIGGLGGSLTGLLMNLATLAALIVAIPLVTAGELDGVFLAVIALAVIAGFEAVVPLPSAALYLGNSLEAGRRLFEIVDAEPEVHDPAAPSPAPKDYGLWLRDVRFRYQPDGPPALDGVSLCLPRGGAWRSSAPAALASPPWRTCCCAFGTMTRVRSPWADASCGPTGGRTCGVCSAWCRSTPISSTPRCATTCSWPGLMLCRPIWSGPRVGPRSTTSSFRCPRAMTCGSGRVV